MSRSRFFLLGDSVYLARKKHRPATDMPNLETMVIELIKRGTEMKVCTTCVNARGFEPKSGEVASCLVGKREGGLTATDLIDNVKMSTMDEFVNLVDASERIITF